MAVRKVKDDKGNEFEIEIDDDDDTDDGPFIDEAELKGLFEKWLGERESSQSQTKTPPKKGAVRIKASQQKPPTTDQQKPRRLRLA